MTETKQTKQNHRNKQNETTETSELTTKTKTRYDKYDTKRPKQLHHEPLKDRIILHLGLRAVRLSCKVGTPAKAGKRKKRKMIEKFATFLLA